MADNRYSAVQFTKIHQACQKEANGLVGEKASIERSEPNEYRGFLNSYPLWLVATKPRHLGHQNARLIWRNARCL
jgi:hypothetical protein